MRRLGPMHRSFLTAGALLAVITPLGCANPFDTDTKNPNAAVEQTLDSPTAATSLVSGLGASVTRALTAINGPYSMSTDELTWVGSREYWKTLDDGDISDPVNEYSDGAYPFVSEARWLANYVLPKVIAWDAAGSAVVFNRRNYVRAHIYAAVIYITIADVFDDFVLTSDRAVAGPAVGPANMRIFYDSAVVFLDRALPVAVAVADLELQRQVLALRARARFSHAAWGTLRPSLAAPANPLVSVTLATNDAAAMLALGGGTPESWRFRLTPTATNLAGINLGFEMNNRGEIRAGNEFVVADPARPIVPLAGIAGIRMLDPVTGIASTTVANAIDACCRAVVGNLVPFTVASAREMRLIQAEERLFAADNANFLARLNTARSVDGLPPYPSVVGNGRAQLQYERKVQLFLQTRRLTDMYRFGSRDPRWLTTQTTSLRACFIPIGYGERQQNVLAPQPNNQRLCQ